MFLTYIFNSKVIYNEETHNGSPFVPSASDIARDAIIFTIRTKTAFSRL
jgi:hypothetical protein